MCGNSSTTYSDRTTICKVGIDVLLHLWAKMASNSLKTKVGGKSQKAVDIKGNVRGDSGRMLFVQTMFMGGALALSIPQNIFAHAAVFGSPKLSTRYLLRSRSDWRTLGSLFPGSR